MRGESILDLERAELRARLIAEGIPGYRAVQIWQAVYRELAADYRSMSTLPIRLREALSRRIPFPTLEMIGQTASRDKRTKKALLRLADDATIETVVMSYEGRRTACVSTQVGCAMGCSFCATGRMGFERNLCAGEIVGQVLHVARETSASGARITHIVYMGMGEPLENYEETIRSIRILNDSEGFGLGARSFTISTVGIVPGIDRLATEGIQVNLAVSLHAVDDALRDRLVPANRRYPVDVLLAACRRYTAVSRRRLSFEVVLIEGVNDTTEDAKRVAVSLRGMRCHVNLIPLNPVLGTGWRGSRRARVRAYAAILEAAGIPVTVRVRRGIDIRAGCGQLRSTRINPEGGPGRTPTPAPPSAL